MHLILLDAGPLGMVTNPKASPDNRACNEWLSSLLEGGSQELVPEIADYEVRRELLRAKKTRGLARLDALKDAIGFVPITTEAMLKAAEFWASARQRGQPTADDKALDGDVILAAQADMLRKDGHDVVVATTNVGHLLRFVPARSWVELSPDSTSA